MKRVRFAGWIALSAAVLVAFLVYAWTRPELLASRSEATPRTKEASPEITNNVSLTPHADALKRLEEEFSKTFKVLSPKQNLDAIPTPNFLPAPTVVISTPRTKPDSERETWPGLTPEESAKMAELERFLDTSNPSDKERKSSKQSRYDELFGKPGQPNATRSVLGEMREDTKLASESDAKKRKRSDEEEEANLPQSLKDTRKQLTELMHSDADNNFFSSSAVKSGLSDWFKPADDRSFDTDTESRRAYMEQYRQMLNGPAVAARQDFSSLLSPPTGSAPAPRPGLSPLDTGAGLGTSSLGERVSALNPTLSPRRPEDASTKALNQWNPMYVPPKPVTPQAPPPPKPTFEFPKRQF